MPVDLNLYRVFYYVARAGSISGAAQTLFVSQPAVSQAIKRLESDVGVQLLLRTPRGIRLTPEGETLFQYVDQAFGFLAAAERKLAEMKELVDGEIRIGASDTLCRYFLIPHLEEFHSAHPNVKIHVTNGTTLETIALLRSGKVDIGVINLPIEPDDSLFVTEAMHIRDCFVAGERFKEVTKSPISLKALVRYPLLMLEKGSTTRRFMDGFARSLGVELSPEVELGSLDLLIEFARIGLGVSCVVREFIDENLLGSELFEVNLVEQIPPRTVGVVSLKDVPLSPAARTFASMLMEESAGTQPRRIE